MHFSHSQPTLFLDKPEHTSCVQHNVDTSGAALEKYRSHERLLANPTPSWCQRSFSLCNARRHLYVFSVAIWVHECPATFQQLMNVLTDLLRLHYCLQSDVALRQISIGPYNSVLKQTDASGIEYHIPYFSRKLNRAQKA